MLQGDDDMSSAALCTIIGSLEHDILVILVIKKEHLFILIMKNVNPFFLPLMEVFTFPFKIVIKRKKTERDI